MASAAAIHAPAPDGRIGPNAVLRLRDALEADFGPTATEALFVDAGLTALYRSPPHEMVHEQAVARLHEALRSRHGMRTAMRISRWAGEMTGDYLLANRIPAAARRVLPYLPATVAARVLVRAMSRHAWTFAGSGRFETSWARGTYQFPGEPQLELRIVDCPLCRGARVDGMACEYYAATFERLFRVLMEPDCEVREVACSAAGAAACRFAVRW